MFAGSVMLRVASPFLTAMVRTDRGDRGGGAGAMGWRLQAGKIITIAIPNANLQAETRRTQRSEAATELREAFGVRGIPPLSTRRGIRPRGNTPHSKPFA